MAGPSLLPTPLNSLSTEIFRLIIEYVYDTSLDPFPNLLLVSRDFYECASPLRHRHLTIDFETDQSIKDSLTLINKLTQHPDQDNRRILGWIRSLTVKSVFDGRRVYATFKTPTYLEEDPKWTALLELVSCIPYLKEVTFDATHPVPQDFLIVLEQNHPKAHLHVRNWSRVGIDTDHKDPDELALAHSPNLRSIQMTMVSGVYYDLRFAAFKRIIELSPNLKNVDVEQTLCGGHASDGFYIDGPEALQRDEVKFAVKVPSSNFITTLKIAGKDFCLLLRDAIDFSKIETLCLDLPYFDSKYAVTPMPSFPALKNLEVKCMHNRNHQMDDSVMDSLRAFTANARLTELSLTDYLGDSLALRSLLAQQGLSLCRLKLYVREARWVTTADRGLTSEVLCFINQSCPNLQEISLDLRRSDDGHTEKQSMTALAAFPRLEIIRISIDLRSRRHENYRVNEEEEYNFHKPPHHNPFHAFDDHCVENFWSYITSEKAKNNNTQLLRELHIAAGDWSRIRGYEEWDHREEWNYNNRFMSVVTPGERDDRPNEVCVRTCRSGDRRRTDVKDVVKEVLETKQIPEKIVPERRRIRYRRI